MALKRQTLDVENAGRRVTLQADVRSGAGPAIVWLGGFKSDMTSTKAAALDQWAAGSGHACLRFDYSGHGVSGGDFADGTIGRWCDEAVAMIRAFGGARPILVGSSMGGWIALLATLRLKQEGSPHHPGGLVLIAPAVDFTEKLMWAQFPDEVRREVMENGVWMRQSEYSPDPYPITRALIEDGRAHQLLGKPLHLGCPVHILQGGRDPDVPAEHALLLVEHLPRDPVTVTMIPDGDHRLSREQDIAKLVAITAAMVAGEDRA
jgi:pimeloyl-ACP methyl ester carboxylesterase